MRNILWSCAVTCAALCCCSTHRKNQDPLLSGIHICTSAARYAGTFQEFNRIIRILFEIFAKPRRPVPKGTVQGPRLHPQQLRKWVKEVQAGTLTQEQLVQLSGRKPDTVRKWFLRRSLAEREDYEQLVVGSGLQYNKKRVKRKIVFGSGLKTYSPGLRDAFLESLEITVVHEKRKVPFSITLCSQTFRNVALEVYPEGLGDQQVKAYVKASYGRRFKRSRGGKQQTVLSRPKAEPGRAILQRVLREACFH